MRSARDIPTGAHHLAKHFPHTLFSLNYSTVNNHPPPALCHTIRGLYSALTLNTNQTHSSSSRRVRCQPTFSCPGKSSTQKALQDCGTEMTEKKGVSVEELQPRGHAKTEQLAATGAFFKAKILTVEGREKSPLHPTSEESKGRHRTPQLRDSNARFPPTTIQELSEPDRSLPRKCQPCYPSQPPLHRMQSSHTARDYQHQPLFLDKNPPACFLDISSLCMPAVLGRE